MGNIWMDWEEMTLDNPVVRGNIFGVVLITGLMCFLVSYLKHVGGELEKEQKAAAEKAAAEAAAPKKKPKKVE